MQSSMENLRPVVYEEGRTEDNYTYGVTLSPLHGISYYSVNQDALVVVDDEQLNLQDNHVLSQSGSDILARWEFRILGSLDPDFEHQLISGFENVTTLPVSIRNSIVSSINGLVRDMPPPSASTGVSIGVHLLINLYLDGDDEEEEEEEEEDDEEEEEEEEEEDEEEEEEEEYNEIVHGMEMDRASSQGIVVLELETVKIEKEMKEDRCAICLEEFIADSMAAKLHCSHIFHDACVRQWLENRGTCPMCRSTLSVSIS